MDIEIVRMSSRGQFVFPLSFRRRYRMARGEKLMLIDNKGTIVVRPVRQLNDDIADEIYMAKRAAKGWAEIEKGHARKLSKREFLKELSTW